MLDSCVLWISGMTRAVHVVGGIGLGLDAQATAVLKNYFHRARPSADLHSSFSFPSGHSTSVYFMAGFLFFIIVPAVYETVKEDAKHSAAETSDPSAVEPHNRALETLEILVKPQNAAALTVAFGATTQAGRLLADVHWFSDVMAGMIWGSCGVALAIIVQDVVVALAGKQLQAAQASEATIKEDRTVAKGIESFPLKSHDE
jgi:membrane-associated phospholipid phosphatase